MKDKWKNSLASLLISIAAVFALTTQTGCGTLDPGDDPVTEKYRPLVYSITYAGSVITLRNSDEDVRTKFEQVNDSLSALLITEQIDAFAVARVLSTLPVKELQGDDAQLIISTGAALLVVYDDALLTPETKSTLEMTARELRVIAGAIRDGIRDALAATAGPQGAAMKPDAKDTGMSAGMAFRMASIEQGNHSGATESKLSP